tara:strand:+ start:226 stop:678 length:453 start_codon:yes stop_codon:yes gene_type:complete
MEKYQVTNFEKQILKLILNDEEYARTHSLDDVTSSYRKFIQSMYDAIDSGRRITPKMSTGIRNAVRRYQEWRNPTFVRARMVKYHALKKKIDILRNLVKQVSKNGEGVDHISAFRFINSVEKHARDRGSLSAKQKLALNEMYKKYKNKLK